MLYPNRRYRALLQRHRSSLATLSILALAGSVIAADNGILMKERLSDNENYCYMKFSAIKEGTLGARHPQLKDTSSGVIVDFYGSRDETPTSKNNFKLSADSCRRRLRLTGPN